MYVSFSEYVRLGYSTVSENEFSPWQYKAEIIVRRRTFGRITEDNITDTNKRGVCELIELLYSKERQINKRVQTFSNKGYRETRMATGGLTENDIISLYFTSAQCRRGV